MSSTTTDRLRSDLKRLWGHDDFRGGQREIIEAVLAGQDVLAILPTGGGKSLTYQFPAMLLDGVTLVLSPLIALMKDQAENLPPDVAAQTTVINSSLDQAEIAHRLSLIQTGKIKLIYAAPERLRNAPFLHALTVAGVALVVIDEAHCISQWGHDFRPDYRAVGQAITTLNPRSVLAVTATATPEVADDIERQSGRTLHRITRPTFRENLHLSCRRVAGEDEKLQTTLDLCRETEGVGLVYCGSREKCEQIARMLRRYNVSAGFYHAGLPPEERSAAQDRFMSGDIRVMAATVAFGMGVDKADIRFLIHYNPSPTLENYYQEAGRAGRDGLLAHCTLLHSTADASAVTRHLREDTLSIEQMRNVYQALRGILGKGGCGLVSWETLLQTANVEEDTLRTALPLLEEVGMIARHRDTPRRVSVQTTGRNGVFLPAALSDFYGNGDTDAEEFARNTNIALPNLELTLLGFHEAGSLIYRSWSRTPLFEILPAPDGAKERLAHLLEMRIIGARKQADAMLDYARGEICRHKTIAKYFGDRWAQSRCERCDICVKVSKSPVAKPVAPTNKVDLQNAPLVVLQLVADLAKGQNGWAIGKSGIVRTLRGTPDAPVKPNRSKAFGALAALKKADAERLVDALVERNYLWRDENSEWRTIHLTPHGEEAVTDGSVDIDWRSKITAETATESVDVNTKLLGALKNWRQETAQEANVPNYCIFADKVLTAIAASQPANEFDLLSISGIGPAKSAKYGDAVLGIVRKHKE